jgi:hypothetical protein
LSESGFGGEVREAMNARIDHLIAEGLARRQGQRIIFASDLLDTLRQRELDTMAAQLAANTCLAYESPADGEHIAGLYRQRVTLASGRFAMIDNGLGAASSLGPHLWSDTLGNRCLESLCPAAE